MPESLHTMSVRLTNDPRSRTLRSLTGCNVTQSLDRVAHGFTIRYTPEFFGNERFHLEAGDPIDVLIDDEVVTDGFIIKHDINKKVSSPHRQKVEHEAQCASRSVDLVDCTSPVRPRRFRGVPITEPIAKLCEPHGISVQVLPVETMPMWRKRFDKHSNRLFISENMNSVRNTSGIEMLSKRSTTEFILLTKPHEATMPRGTVRRSRC